MAVYTPLFVYLTPASIPQVVAHIQKYLADNPIVSDPEAIAEVIQQYIEEHPEIIAVASVNGKTGNVVLTGSDININASSAVSVETQLLNLASMISSAGSDITQIEAQLTTIYTNIGTIETNVSNNTTAISALQTSVAGQGTRLASAESDIDSLESAQSAQNTRLNTAEVNISSLQTRMTQAETDIDSNESSIGTLNTTIGTVQTNISAIQSKANSVLDCELILSATTVPSQGTTLNLSKSVTNYKMCLIDLYVTAEHKIMTVPSFVYGEKIDISWPSTDSLSYFGIFTVTLNNSTIYFNKSNKGSGYGSSNFNIRVYGVVS